MKRGLVTFATLSVCSIGLAAGIASGLLSAPPPVNGVQPVPRKTLTTIYHDGKEFTADSTSVSYGSISVHFVDRSNGKTTRVYGNFYTVEEELKQ